MNSEELELSLRTEFEKYLKNNLAEIKQELSQLQDKVNTELERHKSQLDEFFEGALSNFEKERELEPSFKETVMEHLRLSKDEGAKITANAFAQAEEMEKDSSSSTVGIKEIYEAVQDISSKTTQSEILKTLVHHATHFTPRGAFFIIKNEHLVGWRVFGREKGSAEEKVREVFLPLSANSVLSQSIKTLSTVSVDDGGYEDDTPVLQSLEFGHPQKMLAVPLVARGRGVAVLYADYGNEGGEVNAEALETLVRVAGLTVEVLASNKSASNKKASSKKSASEAEEIHSSAEHYQAETQTVVAEKTEVYAPVTETTSGYQEFVSEPTPVVDSTYESYNADAFAAPVVEPIEPANQFVVSDYQIADDSQIEEVHVDAASHQVEQNYSAFDNNSWSSTTDEVTEKTEVAEPVAEVEQVQEFQAEDLSKSFEPIVDSSQNFTPVIEVETEKFSQDYTPVVENQPIVEEIAEVKTQTQVESPAFETQTDYSYQSEEEKYPGFETNSWTSSTEEVTPSFSAQEFAENFAKETDPTDFAKDFSFPVENNSVESASVLTESFNAEEFVPTKEQTFGSFDLDSVKSEKVEVTQPISTPSKSRLSERNVDLPIEVSEDERRLHNDARRFARLLVSEIKLYNEQKVKEGREANDLYDRLREAIDRSREMYDKRVQPPVASKFDYFHYELINTLAEGDDNKLGASYPGANV